MTRGPRTVKVTLPGTSNGGELEAEDVDVSVDLIRLLRVALRVVP